MERINIPNVISLIRIILSMCLLISEPFKVQFWCIYIVCGLSDMADGYFARKYNMVSKTGAVLDSLGDTVFAVVMVALVLFNLSIPKWSVIWIVAIGIIRLLSILVGYFKFNTYTALHTYINKSIGLLLFVGLPIYIIWNFCIALVILLVIATLATVEELIIIIMSKSLDRNIKSIFSFLHESEEYK